MKPTTKLLLAAIVMLLIIYGMFAFVLAELNPFVWKQEQRTLMAAVWLTSLCLTPLIFFINDTKH